MWVDPADEDDNDDNDDNADQLAELAIEESASTPEKSRLKFYEGKQSNLLSTCKT